jgi:hypothetical protein
MTSAGASGCALDSPISVAVERILAQFRREREARN